MDLIAAHNEITRSGLNDTKYNTAASMLMHQRGVERTSFKRRIDFLTILDADLTSLRESLQHSF